MRVLLETDRLHILYLLVGKLTSTEETRVLENELEQLVTEAQDSLELLEKQCIDLENDKKTFKMKVKKRTAELERTEKRLKMLQNVRPAFMVEFEALEEELAGLYTVYVEKLRNIDYLESELAKYEARERARAERQMRLGREEGSDLFDDEVEDPSEEDAQAELFPRGRGPQGDQEIPISTLENELTGSHEDGGGNFNADLEGSKAIAAESSHSFDTEEGIDGPEMQVEDDIATGTLTDDLEIDDDDMSSLSQEESAAASIVLTDSDGDF